MLLEYLWAHNNNDIQILTIGYCKERDNKMIFFSPPHILSCKVCNAAFWWNNTFLASQRLLMPLDLPVERRQHERNGENTLPLR